METETNIRSEGLNAVASWRLLLDDVKMSSCCRHLFGEGRTADIREAEGPNDGDEDGARSGKDTARSWVKEMDERIDGIFLLCVGGGDP